MAGEIFNAAILSFVVILIGLAGGFALLKLQAEPFLIPFPKSPATVRLAWVHLNFVKTQKLNAFRQEARGKRQELGKRQEGKRDALDKKQNIRYFYKYGMLPLASIVALFFKNGISLPKKSIYKTDVLPLMGTALSLKGKTVAVTGASGTLGRALLLHLQKADAKVIVLTSKPQTVTINIDGEEREIQTFTWQIDKEKELAELLEKVDILVLNHGINVHGERTPEAISQSYEVNTFSSWRLMELFFETVRDNEDIARKEVWVNTSKAEANPALSPLDEPTKRALGDLVTLRKLDAPCVVRKLILGPFKSNLNTIRVMSAGEQVSFVFHAINEEC